MRKQLLPLLGILLSISLVAAACGDDDDGGGSADGVVTCLVTDLAGIDDKSFNATAWNGVLQAIEAGDAASEPDSFFLESDTEADWQPNVDQMIEQGCEHIVTVGFALGPVTIENGPTNPDVDWTMVDNDLADDDFNDLAFDNVRELTYQTDEAAFLAGYLAASVSETGVIGTFGGANFPTVSIFMDGLAWGVDHYNEVNGTAVEVKGWDPDNPDTGLFTGDFTNLELARTTAQSLLDEGADVLMPVGGQINLGAAAAMEDLGMGVNGEVFGALIGVDTDQFISAPQHEDLWLTSVEKKMDLDVAASIAASADGSFAGGNTRGFLNNNGVGLSPFHNFEDAVSDETRAEIEQIQQDIIDGTIVPGE